MNKKPLHSKFKLSQTGRILSGIAAALLILVIVLLLLLMSGDCQEDQNTALLTLALYLFL